MDERTTILTSLGGKRLVVLTKLTAGERNRLRAVATSFAKVGADLDASAPNGMRPKIESINLGALDTREAELIRVCVKEYGELKDAESILAALLEGDADEYDDVLQKVDAALAGSNPL